ncbi:MAG: inositol monophosphatase family protein [Halodesulfurarchaeum sp.]
MRATDSDKRSVHVERVAEAGATAAFARFRSGIETEIKGDASVVTAGSVVSEADRKAQQACLEAIADLFPEDTVIAEEGSAPKTVPEDGIAWVVDPIDGTYNFVRGLPAWASAVAVVEDGAPAAAATVAPAVEERYHTAEESVRLNGSPVGVSGRTDPASFAIAYAVVPALGSRGAYASGVAGLIEQFGETRRIGSLQLALARVAAGRMEGVVTPASISPWDSAGGVGMVRAAGGIVTDLQGEAWQLDSQGLIASNGAAHDHLLAVAQRMAARD